MGSTVRSGGRKGDRCESKPLSRMQPIRSNQKKLSCDVLESTRIRQSARSVRITISYTRIELEHPIDLTTVSQSARYNNSRKDGPCRNTYHNFMEMKTVSGSPTRTSDIDPMHRPQ